MSDFIEVHTPNQNWGKVMDAFYSKNSELKSIDLYGPKGEAYNTKMKILTIYPSDKCGNVDIYLRDRSNIEKIEYKNGAKGTVYYDTTSKVINLIGGEKKLIK